MRSDAAQVLQLLRDDFGFYAPNHLWIVDKMTRKAQPLAFNPSQAELHRQVEEQRQRCGWVRKIVVKGRQQGISTWIVGRGYWRATMRPNTKVGILTHEEAATKNLFEMVRRYHTMCPQAMRPHATTDAANAMAFSRIGSSYQIGTARTRSTGRSATLTFFHGSEVAYWPNIKDNLAGIGQALALAPETEGYLESTAHGKNEFHALTQLALKGQSDYEVCFLPWFLEPGYKRPVPKGFELTDEDWEYADTYSLSLEQMAWRQAKIATDFSGDAILFDQEYPASLVRAFRGSSTEHPFIKLVNTEAARKRTHKRRGPKRLGIDPSQGTGKSDRFSFVERDDAGVTWKHHATLQTDDTMVAASYVVRVIRERDPDAVFIDRLGLGAGICDKVSELLPERLIIGVKASEKAIDTGRYFNKRAEMWGEMRDWIVDGAALLDDDELEADLTGPSFDFRGEAYRLESKDSMKKRGLPSPDDGDALAHTFYVPVEVAQGLSTEDRRSGASDYVNWKTV